MMKQTVLTGSELLFFLAERFVDAQKGQWDHAAWLSFLFDLQKRGFEMHEAMKPQVGALLEALKQVYLALSSTEKISESMLSFSELTVNYLKQNNGAWNQNDWVSYCQQLQRCSATLNDQTISYYQDVFVALQAFDSLLPYKKFLCFISGA
jgi:hypothetical protein